MARRIGWICLAFSLLALFTDTTQAQIWHPAARAVQAPLRFLGHGNGHGFHHNNPGPDVSYYNPWSQKNSFLISQTPEFQARYGHETRQTPLQLLHSGNISWGQQSRFAPMQPTPIYPATAPLSADFVPTKSSNDANDQDAGGDFQPSSSDDDVEDRFEEEADSMDDNEAGDSVGGFDSLKESINTPSEAASLLSPNGVFLPASHSGR